MANICRVKRDTDNREGRKCEGLLRCRKILGTLGFTHPHYFCFCHSLCGSVDTSLCTNVILLQSPTFSDVCVIQNVIDTKRNSAHYMSALEVLSQCAVFIYFLFIYLLFSVSRHSNAI